ncbi:sensor histidine kinase [Arcanobacterium bovis]|uniref:Sensor-like histidine kinase SenX3 n=1 Tax=Arcanobacterium bovis TaxID=2529275 RepID=A0A4Q9V402_9ACTO|nr:ATP-binding protein [Arcanobacterium bovis]TBW23852.1 two-component sensor histidine kinase [Arcanobacterium bovis]
MHDALIFVLGIALGASTVAVVWLTETRILKKRTQKKLVEDTDLAEQRVMSMLDALPQGVIVVNPDLTIRHSSELATAFGLIQEGALRRNIASIVTTVLETGVARDAEFDMRKTTKDSPSRRIWVRVAPVMDTHAIVLFEDQTEKRRLDQTRRDFVANVSHELKTPVGAIKLLSETLQQVSGEAELVENFANKLEQESARLGELVQEIIQLSRLQEGDALANPQVLSVDDVVAEAIERMQLDAQLHGITLRCGGTKGLQVVGDHSLLTTAVRNLLDNAVRYSPSQSTVSVGLSADGGKVKIAVIDEGVGIPREIQDRVFERFYRADEARSRDTGGTGLGLSIVKHVIADHGGSIGLWSEVGRGSTFTISLPRYEEPVAVAHSGEQANGAEQ